MNMEGLLRGTKKNGKLNQATHLVVNILNKTLEVLRDLKL